MLHSPKIVYLDPQRSFFKTRSTHYIHLILSIEMHRIHWELENCLRSSIQMHPTAFTKIYCWRSPIQMHPTTFTKIYCWNTLHSLRTIDNHLFKCTILHSSRIVIEIYHIHQKSWNIVYLNVHLCIHQWLSINIHCNATVTKIVQYHMSSFTWIFTLHNIATITIHTTSSTTISS
jgi:hypothetical protein